MVHLYDPTLSWFSAPPKMPGMNFYELGIAGKDKHENGMEFRTLKSFLESHSIRNNTRKLLKLDVEKAEYETLNDAHKEKLLKEFDHVIMEVHWINPNKTS